MVQSWKTGHKFKKNGNLTISLSSYKADKFAENSQKGKDICAVIRVDNKSMNPF